METENNKIIRFYIYKIYYQQTKIMENLVENLNF